MDRYQPYCIVAILLPALGGDPVAASNDMNFMPVRRERRGQIRKKLAGGGLVGIKETIDENDA